MDLEANAACTCTCGRACLGSIRCCDDCGTGPAAEAAVEQPPVKAVADFLAAEDQTEAPAQPEGPEPLQEAPAVTSLSEAEVAAIEFASRQAFNAAADRGAHISHTSRPYTETR